MHGLLQADSQFQSCFGEKLTRVHQTVVFCKATVGYAPKVVVKVLLGNAQSGHNATVQA